MVKPVVNKALAVGLLVAVTGTAFLVAFTFFKKGGYAKSESYRVFARFSDATGLTWKSRVQIAGIQIGEVEGISLEGAKALLKIRIKNEVELHDDACLYKTFPSALLPDALLEVAPGSADHPALKSLPEDRREITCIREATSVQQLLDVLSRIASDVQVVTGDLAQTVRGNEGSLRNVIENLAATTANLRRLMEENDQNVSQILRNTRDFTGDLRDISGRDKERIHDILVNVEELTAQLRTTAASLQGIMVGKPGAAGPAGGAAAPPLGAPEAGPGTPAPSEAKGVQQAVEKLNDSLAKLDDILGKVQEGKSAAGRLLVDERMGRQLGDTVAGLAENYDRVNRMQIQLHLRSEWLLNQSVAEGRPGAKVYFGVRLIPRPDKYYELELVSDPRGVNTVVSQTQTTSINGGPPSTAVTNTVTNQQTLAFSLEMAKRYGILTVRGGIIESSGGVGADLHLLHETLRLSLNIFQFNRPGNKAFPRAKLWADYIFLQHLYATSGVDDFLNRWSGSSALHPFSLGTDVFFGVGIEFTDDDLKTLFVSGAASAASSATR